MKFYKPSPALFLILFSFLTAQGIAQEIIRPPLLGIAYVEIAVSDIDKAAVFYNSLLGYKQIPGKADPGKKIHSFEIRMNARQSVKITGGLPAAQDERLITVAFQTTDIKAMKAYLESKNMKVPEVARDEDRGLLCFQLSDPDKHVITFVQYTSSANTQTSFVANAAAISARILHAGLTIASPGKADAFYKDILGFSETWRGGSTDSVTSWINMRLPESTDYIEYMLVNAPVNRQQLGSLHHIALMVPDMQQALDVLNNRANGYPVAAPRIGRNKRWQLNLFDPDGTRVELMEPFPMK
jgi:catechol 2,3-dioxygenase-like lactoylglutathione lyase family enzyme